MGKKRELDIAPSDFRRRPLRYLDRAYETEEPLCSSTAANGSSASSGSLAGRRRC